jgi:hypothetical protein
MAARTRQALIDKARIGKPLVGQDLVDLIDTMFAIQEKVDKDLQDMKKLIP